VSADTDDDFDRIRSDAATPECLHDWADQLLSRSRPGGIARDDHRTPATPRQSVQGRSPDGLRQSRPHGRGELYRQWISDAEPQYFTAVEGRRSCQPLELSV
jgi:hypothetical protein